MQNKFSTFLAVSGLVIITSSVVAPNKSKTTNKNLANGPETTYVQIVNTNKCTFMPEWNVGCGNCAG